QGLDELLVFDAVEQDGQYQPEDQCEDRVEDQPEDDVVADGVPRTASGKIGKLARKVLEPDEVGSPRAGVEHVDVVALQALDCGQDGRDQQVGSHEDEGRPDPYPGPDLRSIFVRQPADQVLAAHDVGGEHRGHAQDDDKESRYVLQQKAEVHSISSYSSLRGVSGGLDLVQ